MYREPLDEYLHIRVPSDLVRELKIAAAKDDRTISSWVRTHLKHLVDYDVRRDREPVEAAA